MAKSIEQKAVDALANTLSDSRFRDPEFARLMIEQHPIVHQSFFRLIHSYLTYIAVHAKHSYFPNGIGVEALKAEKLVEVLKEYS